MQLKLLWELQEVDLTIAALNKNIEEAPQKSGVEEAKSKVLQLNEEKENLGQRYRDQRKNLKDLELRIQKLTDDRQILKDGMYSGKNTTAKELEQMMRKLELMAGEKSRLEDELLNVMESVEELESSIAENKSALQVAEEDLQIKGSRLKTLLGEQREQLAAAEQLRAVKEKEIDQKLVARYTLLAEKHQGRALALVENDICGGCRVFISSALRGHLYNPSALVYCENCGRLLVKLDDQ